MKCKHCKQEFSGRIPLGLHGWSRRSKGRCSTPAEMQEAGWYLYHGQWLTSKPDWIKAQQSKEAHE